MFRHNLFFKIVALALAVALKLYVSKQETSDERFIVRTLSYSLPAGQELVEPTILPKIRVRLTGPAGELQAVDPQLVEVSLDTSGYQPGSRLSAPVRVSLPANVADSVRAAPDPASIAIRGEERAERRFPVSVEVGELPEGLERVGSIDAQPAEVVVRGLQSDLERVQRVVARITELRSPGPFNRPVTLRALDKNGASMTGGVDLQPSQVQVRGLLERTVWSARAYVQPIFETLPIGMRVKSVTVDPRRVTLYGSQTAVNSSQVLETQPLTVPEGQTEWNSTVRLTSPDGITRIVPESVRVTVVLEPVAEAPRPPGDRRPPTPRPPGTGG